MKHAEDALVESLCEQLIALDQKTGWKECPEKTALCDQLLKLRPNRNKQTWNYVLRRYVRYDPEGLDKLLGDAKRYVGNMP